MGSEGWGKKLTNDVGQNSGDGSNTYSKVDCPHVSLIVRDVISFPELSIRERTAPESLHKQPLGSLELLHQRFRIPPKRCHCSLPDQSPARD
jgi:hypothetical protein